MPDNPLHAQHYADQASFVRAAVTDSSRIAECTYCLRVSAADIAKVICPGQFMMVRIDSLNDPLIGRAFAMYQVIGDEPSLRDELEFAFIAKGKMTTRLAELAVGATVEIWGPLGNGFDTEPCEHLIMAAGGIGQTPFLALGREALGLQQFGSRTKGYAKRATLVYGVRNKAMIAGEKQFIDAGIELDICTDDGSRGYHGLVPDRVNELLACQDAGQASDQSRRVVCCGPEPMMQRTAEVCHEAGVACSVSLETPMACGIGICFSCVAKVKLLDGSWDYKRTCVDGPVFDSQRIVW